jgi:hypothetical protein
MNGDNLNSVKLKPVDIQEQKKEYLEYNLNMPLYCHMLERL